MFLCLILLAGLARFAWVKNLGRCTQTSLRFLFSCLLSSRHAELVSASHREPFLVLLRGQILKRVQDDICVLTAHRSLLKTQKLVLLFFCQKSKSAVICRICVISVSMKILYKIAFSYKSSWKVESAQLENFYFPTGKLFFLSWKIKISQ